MKKFTIQAILLLIVISIAVLFFAPTGPKKISLPFLPENSTLSTLKINDVSLRVEIADTSSKRNRGLGGRDSLASDSGMLFIFEKMGNYPFWMKGMKFPLDLIWIRGDKVVDIMKNIPSPALGQKNSDLPIYQSKESIDKVLEVSSGTADRLNIKIGDTLKL